MKLILKWLIIGFASSLVTILVFLYLTTVNTGATDIGTVTTSHFYEVLSGVVAIIVFSAGLPIIIPAIIIAVFGFLLEKFIGKQRNLKTYE